MTQTRDIAFLAPLLVGACAIGATIIIHAIALNAAVNFVRRERRRGHIGKRFWFDVTIVGSTIAFALAAHLVEIAIWALLFVASGEFLGLGIAYYHSALYYTTLGDVGMSPGWSLLGPLEAVDGMLMFGVSTAMIFAVIQRLLVARYADLRD
jgi:hypothetical protein